MTVYRNFIIFPSTTVDQNYYTNLTHMVIRRHSIKSSKPDWICWKLYLSLDFAGFPYVLNYYYFKHQAI